MLCLMLMLTLFTSCGTTETPEPAADPAFLAIKPLVDQACGGCHNGKRHPLVFDSGAAFKGSKAKDQIQSGRMPLGGKLKDSDKAKLLAYLSE